MLSSIQTQGKGNDIISPASKPTSCRADKVGISFISPLTFAKFMLAGTFSRFIVSQYTLYLTQCAIVKVLGANLKNEVTLAQRPRLHTAHICLFVCFFTSSHQVLTWQRRTDAPKKTTNVSGVSLTSRDDGGYYSCGAPDSIDSIKTLTRHSAAVIRDAAWIQPPCLSCRALQQIIVVPPADDQPG